MTLTQNTPNGREASLTARVARGAGWLFTGKLAGRGLALVKLVILARLLAPDDFGLFGFMMLVTAGLDALTRMGFDKALIQFQDESPEHLNTAWTIQVIRGFAIALVLYAIAPLAAGFFDEPRIVLLLRVFCVAPVIAGFDNIGVVYFQKELNFRKQVFFGLGSDTVAMVIGIVLALWLRNVWALVGATFAGCMARNFLSYLLHPYRPRFRIDSTSLRRLLRYGGWLLGSSIMVFITLKGDRIILGRLLGATALGVFGMAFQIADLPVSNIADLLTSVMMPAYAKAQQERDRLRRGFLRVLGVVATLVLPMSAFMALAAPEIVLGVIGEDWRAAIGPLRVLAVVGLIRSIESTTTPLFLGTGRPRLQFMKTLIRGLVTLGLAIPLTMRYGVTGTALAGLAGMLALTPWLIPALRIADVSAPRTLRALLPGLGLTVCVAAGVILIRLLPIAQPTARLAVMVAGIALICAPVVWFIHFRGETSPLLALREGLKAILPTQKNA